jgi:RimJ/RimL family protein N-acetyltransferase
LASEANPRSERLHFLRFRPEDAEALAKLLRDPEIARNITADGRDGERALACAEKRIAWHNGDWADKGYGVWALRLKEDTADRLMGWCGFVSPDVPTQGPEILYALARETWGLGLGREAAGAAIDWLFTESPYEDTSALIFEKLNPGSLRVTEALGFRRRGDFPYAEFLGNPELARDVVDYEIWRLEGGESLDAQAPYFQVPYKCGQITGAGLVPEAGLLTRLLNAGKARAVNDQDLVPDWERQMKAAFAEGNREAFVAWFYLSRADWQARPGFSR